MNLMNFLSEQEIVSVAENVAKTTNKDRPVIRITGSHQQ
jgi:hypothetical protein